MKALFDTSIISAYHDERQQERMEVTREFWNSLAKYEISLSQITREELEQINDADLRKQCLELIEPFQILPITNETKSLAQLYIQAEIVPQEYVNDALLIATAAVHNLDSLISWNFKHMANLKVVSKVNAINALSNYPRVDIVSPRELL